MIMKWFKNLGFQKKIFLTCILVSLVPVLILGTFCYYQIKSLLLERERTALRDSLIQESNTLHSHLSAYEDIMNNLIWNENIKQILNYSYDKNFDMYLAYRDTLDPLFSTIKSLNTSVEKITLYTDSNIYPKGNLQPLSDIENLPWYDTVCSNYRTLWLTSAEDQTLSLVRQFYDIPNGITAIIQIDISYSSTFSSLAFLFEHSYGILLTDQEGTPIYQFHTEDLGEQALSPSELLQAAALSNAQEDYIIELSSDICNGWDLCLYRPSHTISDPIQRIIQTVLGIIVACIGFILLLSFAFSNTIVKPLEHLMDDMQQVEQGTFDITVTYDSTDEVGRVIKNFRSMVQKINFLINEVLESKIRQKEQEMRALQAQINPHFLYNSLSLINSKAILSGQEEIGLMAKYLSSFYRTTLNKGKNSITVSGELENIRSYINIQQMMHSNSFDVSYEIADDILPLCMINLLLQPLVENAIIHGIDHSLKPGRGQLRIQGFRQNDTLIFRISDNGPGIPPERLDTLLTAQSSGYGVQNVQNRVQLSYGSQYGLHFESIPDEGTTVTLTLPLVDPKAASV